MACGLATIAAPQTSASADPLILSNVAAPTSVGTGQGKRAIWVNAGTVGGAPIDLVATITTATLNHNFTTTANRASITSVGQDNIWIQWRIFQTGTYDINTDTGGVPVAADVHVQLNDVDGPNNERAFIPVCDAGVRWVRIDKTATTGKAFGTVAGRPQIFSLVGDKNYNSEPVSGLEVLYPNTSTFSYGRTANNGFFIRLDSPTYQAFTTLDYTCADFLPPVAVNDAVESATVTAVSLPILNNDSIATGNASGLPSEYGLQSVSLTTPPGATSVQTDASGDVIGFTLPGQGTWGYDDTTGLLTFTPVPGFTGAPTIISYTFENALGAVSNQATVTVAYPAIGIVKSAVLNDNIIADGRAQPGETIGYSYTVTALGGATINGVTVTETGFTGNGTTPTPTYQSGDTNLDGLLEPSESWVYTASYAIVAADITAGSVSNQATASGTSVGGQPVSDLSDSTNPADGNGTATPGAGTGNDDPTSSALTRVIDAVNDAPAAVNGATGNANAGNVLTNDTLDTAVATTSNVTISVVTPASNAGVTLDTASGTLAVAAATPAGTYTIVYRICETGNPTNCDDASATVTVAAPVIDAANDAPAAVNGATGNANVGNVLTNDTLNGAAATTSTVAISVVTPASNGGVTLNTANGTLAVAAATPAGTYTIVYRICETLNPTNCDDATASVTVAAPVIDAVDDAPASVNGTTGSANAGNVLTNDTLNGTAALTSNVTISVVTPASNGGVTLGTSNGVLSVAAATPAGAYSIVYRICETLNPTNCDTATASITVSPPAIDAVNDAPASVNGATGSANAGNVLANDTLNGAAAVAANVTISVVTPASNGGVTLNTANGTLAVAAGTPAGAYTIAYQICENLNPTNCDTATASVTVTPPAIDAVNDAPAAANGTTGNPSVVNAFANDTLNGAPVSASAVTATIITPASNPGVTLNTTSGVISVAAGTPAGAYTIDYRICENLNPSNCDTATASVTVSPAALNAVDDTPAAVSGATGNPSVVNVFTNDTLNGAPLNPADVTATVVTPASNPGVTIDVSTGVVSVAPGTPAGSYTIVYQICENLNPANCDVANVGVSVAPAGLNAADDTPSAVSGTSGSPSVINVFANDSLNGAPLNPADITATVVTPASDPGVTLDPANGVVSVAAGTPAGSYTIVYQICENLNPGNCDTATVAVTVAVGALVAVDDAPAPVNGTSGNPTVTNVYANDTLDGAPLNPADITATVITPASNPGVTIDLSTGVVSVAPGTPAGSYTIVYQICETANPSNCDTASTGVTVAPGTLQAVDDAPAAVNGTAGNPNVANVYANDTLNGAPLNPADITATIVTPASNPGVTIDLSTGVLSVAPGTPAGTYTIVYQICETLNPTNCDTATTGVTIAPGSLQTVDDTPPPVNGTAGNPNTTNVYANDTLNGAPLNPADITATVITPASNPGVTIDLSTGVVSVAPGRPAGSYTIVYQVCETINPSNCDTATTGVTVAPGTLVAVDDTPAPVSGSSGNPSVTNVYANDTLNGAPLNPGDITATVITPASNPGVTIDLSTGAISVAPGTPAGTYTIVYQVCETLNPSNCDTATTGVTVAPGTLVASDDTLPTPVDSANALSNVINVLDGDTLDGQPATVSNVTVSASGPLPAGFSLAMHGAVDIAKGTPSGLYMFDYRVCENINPSNCDIATVTIAVEKSTPSASGVVFFDANGNGRLDPSEPHLAGYTVELRRAGAVVLTTTSESDGSYLLSGFEPGTGYEILFIDPATNRAVGHIADLTFDDDTALVDQNQPIDPSGIVFNSVTGAPLAGVSVELRTAGGTALPDICLLPGQQGQVTTANGQYRFDLVTGSAPECPNAETEYLLAIAGFPSGIQPAISTIVPPQPGALDATTCPGDAVPGGACQVQADGNIVPGAAVVYYLRFLFAVGDPNVVNNNIPLDPLGVVPASGLTITKRSNVAVARRDEVVTYSIVATNTNLAPAGPIDIVDRLPAGFSFVPDSASVAGVATAPDRTGRVLTFPGLTIPSNGAVEIRLSLRIGAEVTPGDHANEAWANDSATGESLTATARAVVRVMAEHVFDCGEIIGKVFDDHNRDGSQDDGEAGLPGVRVVTVNGILITTDRHGRFSVPCAELPDSVIGSNFIMKLDPRTLPDGYRLTTENPRVVRLTAGKVTKLNFGAASAGIVSIDLSGRAFKKGAAEPTAGLRDGIGQLGDVADKRGSSLRVTYTASGETGKLVNQRLKTVRKLVAAVWREKGKPLPFEIRVVGVE